MLLCGLFGPLDWPDWPQIGGTPHFSTGGRFSPQSRFTIATRRYTEDREKSLKIVSAATIFCDFFAFFLLPQRSHSSLPQRIPCTRLRKRDFRAPNLDG